MAFEGGAQAGTVLRAGGPQPLLALHPSLARPVRADARCGVVPDAQPVWWDGHSLQDPRSSPLLWELHHVLSSLQLTAAQWHIPSKLSLDATFLFQRRSACIKMCIQPHLAWSVCL